MWSLRTRCHQFDVCIVDSEAEEHCRQRCQGISDLEVCQVVLDMLPSHVLDCCVTTQQCAWLVQHQCWKFHNGTYSSRWWLIPSKLVHSWQTSHSHIPLSWAIVWFSWADRRTYFHLYVFWAHLWLFLVCSNTSFITTEPADIVSLVDVKANLPLLPLEVISF